MCLLIRTNSSLIPQHVMVVFILDNKLSANKLYALLIVVYHLLRHLALPIPVFKAE